MDVKNVTLNFETDLILVYNIKYFEALIELISKSKDQLCEYEPTIGFYMYIIFAI